MDVDLAAPVIAQSRIEVAAPPEVVWDTVADFESWTEWYPDVKNISVDGPVAEGTTFRWTRGRSTIDATLRSVERPAEIGWTATTFGIRILQVWRFEPKDGRTLVTSEESFAGWLPRLLRSQAQKRLQESKDVGLRQLKAEVERPASA